MVYNFSKGGFLMKKNINIGLCGFGAMGKVHSFAVNNLDFYYKELPFSASVRGLCTTNIDRTKDIAKLYGFGYAAMSEDELLADEEIDAIDICTPNIYHFETIKKAIAAGKHIYCEKPLCVTADEAREAAALAKKSGLICNIVFNNRHLAPIRRAKQLIDAGRIGRVLSFSAEYLHNSCTDVNRPAGWKQNKDICGGGVLFDLGSHVIDLIRFLCGEFSEVSGRSQIGFASRKGMDGQNWNTNADEAFYMTALLDCGAVGTITVSKLINGANDDLSFAIYGEKGSMRFSLMQPNFLYFYDATEKPSDFGGNTGYTAIECVGRYAAPGGTFPSPKAPADWLRGHVGGMYEFLNSVYTGKSSAPTFLDGCRVQEIMEAAYLSDKTGRFEKVERK